MTPQTVLWLVEHLPDTSALHASLSGEPRGWTYDRHLMTTVTDLLLRLGYIAEYDLTKKKPTPLRPMPRPGDEKRAEQARIEAFGRYAVG